MDPEAALQLLQADMQEVPGFHWPSPYPDRYEDLEENHRKVLLLDRQSAQAVNFAKWSMPVS